MDKPNREKIAKTIYEMQHPKGHWEKLLNQPEYLDIADQIRALIPDEEEIREQIASLSIEIVHLNKKLDDKEADLILAKREKRERILRLLPEIPTRYDHNKTCFDCIESIKGQALKENKCV